jgi:hypothetical protein
LAVKGNKGEWVAPIDTGKADRRREDQYLAPFLCQDSQFPHVVSASTRIPQQALNLILKIHAALPARAPVARLAVKTHMKMLLFLLVKHYEQYLDTCESLDWRQRDIQRLGPVFQFLEQNLVCSRHGCSLNTALILARQTLSLPAPRLAIALVDI